MADLVSNDIDKRAVTGEESRGGEGQTAVLHASVRERVGKNEEVVDAKAVSRSEVLGGRDLFGSVLLELPVGSLHRLGLRPDTGLPVTTLHVREGLVRDLTGGDGDQVRGNGNGLRLAGTGQPA